MSLLSAFTGRWERQFITFNGTELLVFESKSSGAPVMELSLFEDLENIRCEFGTPTQTNFGIASTEDSHNVILSLANEDIYLRFPDVDIRNGWTGIFESIVYQKNLKKLAAQGLTIAGVPKV